MGDTRGSIGTQLEETLERVFGFESLRPGQREVIDELLDRNPVLAVMPTGAGKSLCYQLPAVLLAQDKGMSLVVSPLIALMKDQVDSLCERGVKTTSLTSAASPAEQTEILSKLRRGEYDILYVAPERFYSGRFLEALAQANAPLALLAIDEAHCISEWGHDFRPAYRSLGEAVQKLRPERILAVTATATPEVRTDIVEQLGIPNARMKVRGFARPELCFRVEHISSNREKCARLCELIKKLDSGSVLVYAATRKRAEAYSQALGDAGLIARAYHAGLEDRHRHDIQDGFMSGDVDVVVATNAFGMGVDKSDVRLVVHADIPRSVEAYYQEAGRAGRDKDTADCVLFFAHGDVRLQEFLIDASFPSADLLRSVWKVLASEGALSDGELGLYELPGDPHESTLSSALRILGRHGYAHWDQGQWSASKPERLGGDYPTFDPDAFERRSNVEKSKLQNMVEFGYAAGCRHQYLLDYFGEATQIQDCSACDNCLGDGQAQALSDEETRCAEVLLQIVAHVHGRFGRKKLASIANGTDKDERFYELSQRGALRGHSQKALMELLRSLEAARMVKQSKGEYPTIELTGAGRKVAQGSQSLDPSVLQIVPSKSSSRARRPSQAPDADPKLVEKLRSLRSNLATKLDVPAYVVFSNRSMEELAGAKPTSLEELADIHGFGPSRIAKHGDEILALLKKNAQ